MPVSNVIAEKVPTFVPNARGVLVEESTLALPKSDYFNQLIKGTDNTGGTLQGIGSIGGIFDKVNKAGQVGMLTRGMLTNFYGVSASVAGPIGAAVSGVSALFGRGDAGSKITAASAAIGSIMGGIGGILLGGLGSIIGGLISGRHAKKERAAQKRKARRKILAYSEELAEENKSFLGLLKTSTQSLEEKYSANKSILESNKERLNSAFQRRQYALGTTLAETAAQIDLALATGTTQSGIVSSTSDWFIPQKLDYTAEVKRKELREENEELADNIDKLAVEQDADYRTEKSKLEYAGKKKELEYRRAINEMNDALGELGYKRSRSGEWFFKEISDIGLGLRSTATRLAGTINATGRPSFAQDREFQNNMRRRF